MSIAPKDKLVVRAFTERRAVEGTKLHTDGSRLDGYGMGGNKIAWWESDGIHFGDLGSRTAQSVQNLVHKEAPPNVLPQFESFKDKTSGSHVHLTIRRGVVTGVMGSDPSRFMGKTLEEAKRIASSSASKKVIRVGSRCFKV